MTCAVRAALAVLPFLLTTLPAQPAAADMLLDKVIVDFKQDAPPRADIEVTNTDKQNMYVLVEPAEIVNPGTKEQSRVTQKDPRKLGLLVTPNRLVLEPGQSKIVRLSLLSRPKDRDRIYRVKIHPVVGKLVASQTALKIIVGYDTLVIARPQGSRTKLDGKRDGRKLTLHNSGNTNVLVIDARQCKSKNDCVTLPTTRLYARQEWTIELPMDAPAILKMRTAEGITTRTF